MTTERMLGGFTRTEWLTFLGIATADDPKLAALAALSWGGNALKVLRVNATANGWELAATALLTDGDKGDITVSSTGTVWTIDNDVVTYAKMQNVSAAARFLGRITGGAGDVEELTAANAKTILSLAQADISGLTTADSPQLAGINLGHASDTTFSRVSAGVAAIEGDTIDTLAKDTTATGKKQFDAGLRVTGTGGGFGGTGVGLELDYIIASGLGYVTWYDRGAGAWKDGIVRGLTVSLQASGATIAQVDSTGLLNPVHPTTASAANAHLDSGTGRLSRSTSSRRYKTQIEPVEDQYLDAALELRPVWYRSTSPVDNPDWGHWGFEAEPAAKIDPRLVHWTYRKSDYETVKVKGADRLSRRERRLKAGAVPTIPDGFQYERLTVLHHALHQRSERRIAALEAALEKALTKIERLTAARRRAL